MAFNPRDLAACRAVSKFVCAALLSLSSSFTIAQSAVAYRQSLLAIQQQIEAGNLDDARTMIAAASRTYPHDGGLENLLGVVDVQQDHTEEASKDFSAAILHNPRLESAYLNLSRLRMQTAATDTVARAEALRLSLRALQLDPASDEAHYQAATIYAWNKNTQLSLAQLKKLSPHASEQIGAQALLCADQVTLGPRQAANAAAAALTANSDLTEQDADTCLPALRAAHRADLIEPLFAAVATHLPLSAAGLRILGLAQEAEGKLQPARATLESAFALDSKSVVILEDLTRVAKAAKDNEGALGYLAHARDLDPSNAELPFEFGVICFKMNFYGEARKALDAAVQLAPDNPEYNYELGVIASLGNDPIQGLPYLDKFHSLKPRDAAGILALGITYFRAKNYDTALKWLKQAAANPATALDAHFYLGRLARQRANYDEAIGYFNQCLAVRPDQPDVLAEIGQAYVANRDYPRAGVALERAVQLDPDDYGANFGLLQLYARTNDPRREQQAKRFKEIRNKRDEREDDVMRVILFHSDGDSDHHDTQSN
jgi:tetratricopeptide (TPR) repeat protein